jgi:hypothetical protein
MNHVTARELIRKLLLSEPAWWLAPTPATYYLNRVRLREPDRLPHLPANEWSRRERRTLLDSSEERLRSIEGKGPALATVSAIIVGATLLAITGGWNESADIARVILVLAAVYALLSLLMPLYLVGPVKRHVIHIRTLTEAAASGDAAEETLADRAAEAAMNNELQNMRLTNLLDASRRELVYTLALLVLWVILVPTTELLSRETSVHMPSHQSTGICAPPAATQP